MIKNFCPDNCFIQNPFVSNDNCLKLVLPKNKVSNVSNFLFKRVEKGIKATIEKRPIQKKDANIGERIFHREIPDVLDIIGPVENMQINKSKI